MTENMMSDTLEQTPANKRLLSALDAALCGTADYQEARELKRRFDAICGDKPGIRQDLVIAIRDYAVSSDAEGKEMGRSAISGLMGDDSMHRTLAGDIIAREVIKYVDSIVQRERSPEDQVKHFNTAIR